MKDPKYSRRDVLKVGALGYLGLSLPGAFRLGFGQDRGGGARAKNCILVWLNGGPSHLDTFDLKPDAPVEIRGKFRPSKAFNGAHVCEHLPRIAERMKKLTLIRSITSREGNHDRATHYMLTGYHPSQAVDFPGMGSVFAKERGFGEDVPTYISIPGALPYARSGYLPPVYDPFVAGGKNGPPLEPVVGFDRLKRRREMVEKVDALSRAVEDSPTTKSRDRFFEQAYRLVTSPEAKAAFDSSREPAKTRQAYGHHELGRSCLLARRLVERGARFVTVVDNGWDTHEDLFNRLSRGFPGKLPGLDQAYSALIDDLSSRGLLEETLVVLMGEFGRTPKLNSRGGRDHWPRVNSVVLAGGGVKPGVIGRSDAIGELPDQRPVKVEELVYTIYTVLGIDPGKTLPGPSGRPIPILHGGSPVREIL